MPSTTRAVPLAVKATNELRRLILNGHFLPGHALIETSLAEELGMSKTPIREALRILAISGLVSIDSFRTPRVKRVSRVEVDEIYEVRIALEPIAIERACRNRTPECEQKIETLIDKASVLAKRGALTELVAANRLLHRAFVQNCANEEILKILQNYEERLTLAIIQGWNRIDTSLQEFEEHKEISRCFLQGDANRSAELLRRHIAEHRPVFD